MTVRHLLIARSPILLPHVGAHELDDSSDNSDSRHMVDEETARTKILQIRFPHCTNSRSRYLVSIVVLNYLFREPLEPNRQVFRVSLPLLSLTKCLIPFVASNMDSLPEHTTVLPLHEVLQLITDR
jgi:hypothetical protein